MYTKICGLSTPEAASVAVAAGADAIGVVMSPRSPRTVDESTAAAVLEAVPETVDTVLVVSHLPVADAAAVVTRLGLSVLQLHGSYSDADCELAATLVPRVWRASTLAGAVELRVGTHGEEALLLDAPKAGSGERWDLSELVNRRPDGRWILAGGLDPDNVAEAIATARPWGVDVSSGVESAPGVKDHDRIRAFLTAAQAAFEA